MVRVKPEDQPTDNPVEESTSNVEEVAVTDEAVAAPKKATPKKKATVKRKPKAAPRKRRKPPTKPVVEPIPVPLTVAEGKELMGKAKDDFVIAVAEPVMNALGRYSQMARDAVSGAVGGFLGNKKRGD